MSTTTPPILLALPEEIQGERVLLRPYQPGDGREVWGAVEESRESLLPWLPWAEKHRSVEESETFVRQAQARWLLREDLTIGIWERTSGRFLGGSGLHRIDWEVPSFEIGYWLRRSAEGHGYMTETVSLLCQLAFEKLNANRVFILAASTNLRSVAVPKRLGFLHEATLRNHKRNMHGELYDMVTYALTPEDYRRGAGRLLHQKTEE